MLNMLIAIMANTFDNTMELYSVNTIRSRLQFLSDFHSLLRFETKEEQEEVFMVVVKPQVEEKDEDTWLGSINAITDVTKNQIENEEKRINKKTDKMERSIFRQFNSAKSGIQAIKASQARLEAEATKVANSQIKIEGDIAAMQAQSSQIRDLLKQLTDEV